MFGYWHDIIRQFLVMQDWCLRYCVVSVIIDLALFILSLSTSSLSLEHIHVCNNCCIQNLLVY
jgi:hypothetical protein